MHDASPIEAGALRHLRLAPDVHVCVTQNHAVFLDLIRDQYSAIVLKPERGDEAFALALIEQGPALLKAGLVQEGAGAPPTPLARSSARRHVFGLDDQRCFGLTGPACASLGIGWRDLTHFIAASADASRALKKRHISSVVTKVRAKKSALAMDEQPRHDTERVRRLTAIFCRLRPWFPRPYLCLYDSLALTQFLLRHRVAPDWVFGVQAQPFGAHCWVEFDGLLLNEGSEFAGQYQPIMVV